MAFLLCNSLVFGCLVQVWTALWEDGRWIFMCHESHAAWACSKLGHKVSLDLPARVRFNCLPLVFSLCMFGGLFYVLIVRQWLKPTPCWDYVYGTGNNDSILLQGHGIIWSLSWVFPPNHSAGETRGKLELWRRVAKCSKPFQNLLIKIFTKHAALINFF